MADFYYRDKHAESESGIGPFLSKKAALQAAATQGIGLTGVELFKMQGGYLIAVTSKKQIRTI